MKKLIKSIVVAVFSLTIISCSDTKESAVNKSVELLEEQCSIYEGIKDEASAKAAIEKMDGLTEKYASWAADVKKLGTDHVVSAEDAKALQEQMKPIQERMIKATTSAMTFLATKPELMAQFTEKLKTLGEATTKAAQ